MFPDKDESYLSDVRRNNITLNDTIDDILGIEALEGWFSFRKSKCADNIALKALVMVQHT